MAANVLEEPEAASPTVSEPLSTTVTDDEIARRAYDIFLSRGGEHGHDVEDWAQAERELRAAAPSEAA